MTFRRALVLLTTATAVGAAVTIIVPGAAEAVRAMLAFRLAGRPGSMNDAVTIAATNLRFALALLLVQATGSRTLRATALTATAANAVIVGAAAAAYGTRGLPFLIHVPLEWASLAAALAGRPASAVALIVASALVEVWLTPQ